MNEPPNRQRTVSASRKPRLPFPPFSNAPPTRCEKASPILLKTAGILGPLASLVVVSLLGLLFVNDGRRGLMEAGGWILLFSGAYIWIPAHVLAGCLFLCGLGTQAHSGLWLPRWTAWNAIYFLGLPVLVYALFASIWPT
jgi:hypothetical protein